MGLLKNKSLRDQLLTVFLPLAIIPLIITSIAAYYFSKQIVHNIILEDLGAIASRQIDQLDNYINERFRNVNVVSQRTDLIQGFEELKNLYIHKGINSAEYKAYEKKTHLWIDNILTSYDYENLYLITNAGEIIFNANRGSDLGANLITGSLSDSVLGRVFKSAKSFLSMKMSNFELYEPSQKPAAFIATPLFVKEQSLGIVVFQLNSLKFFGNVNDYTGLKSTGEILLVAKNGDHVDFMSPSRYLTDLKTKIHLGSYRGTAAQGVANGESGSGLITDYRGKETLAVWRGCKN